MLCFVHMTREIKNILLHLADQWRGDTLGAMGHPIVHTPNIDAFAADSTTFSRHYCQALPCGPSRASILKGLYLHKHRVVSNGTPLPADLRNVAQHLQDAEFRPALFGYTDTPLDPDVQPDALHDTSVEDWICPGFTAVAPFLFADGFSGWTAEFAAKGYTLPEDPLHLWDPSDEPYTPAKNGLLAPSRIAAADTDTAWLTERLLVYVDAMAERPWFAHFNCLKPHPPLFASRPYDTLHNPADIPLPVGTQQRGQIAAQHPWLAYEYGAQERRRVEYPSEKTSIAEYDEWDARRLRAAYYGNCSEIDAQIGRIIDRLKSTGTYDETLIIFCSDHGEQLGNNGFWGRRGPYDGNFHVPMIVRDPREAADSVRGSRVNAFTEHVDLLPTILDALQLENTDAIDERSLVPFLHGTPPSTWRDAAHFAYDFGDLVGKSVETTLGLASNECHFHTIRGKQWKYVEFPTLPPLLFDMSNDPREGINLASDPSCSVIVAEYSDHLRRLVERPPGRDLSSWFQPYGGELRQYDVT
jgi:arylsulfatase A-like enzyme